MYTEPHPPGEGWKTEVDDPLLAYILEAMLTPRCGELYLAPALTALCLSQSVETFFVQVSR